VKNPLALVVGTVSRSQRHLNLGANRDEGYSQWFNGSRMLTAFAGMFPQKLAWQRVEDRACG
jgi:hypothetical protein